MEYVGFDRDTYINLLRILKIVGHLHMLNLIKLKEEAIYPDGSITTGSQRHTCVMEKKVNQFLKD